MTELKICSRHKCCQFWTLHAFWIAVVKIGLDKRERVNVGCRSEFPGLPLESFHVGRKREIKRRRCLCRHVGRVETVVNLVTGSRHYPISWACHSVLIAECRLITMDRMHWLLHFDTCRFVHRLITCFGYNIVLYRYEVREAARPNSGLWDNFGFCLIKFCYNKIFYLKSLNIYTVFIFYRISQWSFRMKVIFWAEPKCSGRPKFLGGSRGLEYAIIWTTPTGYNQQ